MSTAVFLRAARAPLAALVAVAAFAALCLFLWRSETVAPPGARSAFDAGQAQAGLARLLPEGPHPAGSAANQALRDRIVTQLRAAGYAPRVQEAFHCTQGRAPGCAFVENIVAEKAGTGNRAVLVAAHYDSVAAGPGGADDGLGLAVVLALARDVAARPAARNGVVFLISDAEEAGLRGAAAFAASDPAMARIGAVVNVDARGAAGPAVMFETGANNGRLVSLFASASPRPVANSVTVEIYKRMPNDTDFSVFRERGLSGYNFAILGAASLYHSARDTPANLDPASLQHMGDNVFAATHALLGADLETLRTSGEASYFDLFGRALIAWPSTLDLPLAVLALLAIIGLAWRDRAVFTTRASGSAAAALVLTPLILCALGFALSFPLGVWPGAHPLDHPEPWPGRVALCVAALCASALAGAVIRHASEAGALLAWLVLAVLGIATAALAPGAAYALTLPVCLFAIAGWVRQESAPALGTGALVFFWTAHFLAAEAVLGFDLSHWRMLTLVAPAWALAPLFARVAAAKHAPPVVAVSGAVALIAACAAMAQPPYTPMRPRGLDFVYAALPGAPPRWDVAAFGPQDENLAKAAGFPGRDRPVIAMDGSGAAARFKPAADLHLPGPSWTPGARTATSAEGELTPARNGFTLGFVIPPGSGVRAVRAEGQVVLEGLDGAAPARTTFAGLAGRAVRLTFAFNAGATPKVVFYERSALPDTLEARALLALRPADAAPAYFGDHALTTRAVTLAP